MCVREERERECVWACVCMLFWSWGSETSEDADEEAHWSLNSRPCPQATEQRICPVASKHSTATFLWPGGLILFLRRPVCACTLPRQDALSEKRCDHTWWENLLEPCVFFLLESICWLVKLQPNSSLITIKVIPAQPQKANCCVCTLRADCCRPTNPTIRQWTVCWCWCCKCKK